MQSVTLLRSTAAQWVSAHKKDLSPHHRPGYPCPRYTAGVQMRLHSTPTHSEDTMTTTIAITTAVALTLAAIAVACGLLIWELICLTRFQTLTVDERVRELRARGATQQAIAETLGVTRYRVRKALG